MYKPKPVIAVATQKATRCIYCDRGMRGNTLLAEDAEDERERKQLFTGTCLMTRFE